jgi:glycogen debranching enzyme
MAPSSLRDDRTRVLKQGDTFAVFDHYGDIKSGGLGEEGLFHESTRYVSQFVLQLAGQRPFFLGSNVRDDNELLTVALTNPDLEDDAGWVPLGTLYIALKKFLWEGVLYQELWIKNQGMRPIGASLALHFSADFADIFEVRGMRRGARGADLPPEVASDRVMLAYRGLDGVIRRSRIYFSQAPSQLTSTAARFDLLLEPHQEEVIHVIVGCERDGSMPRLLSVQDARNEAESNREGYKSWSCHLQTSNDQFNGWIDRAAADLYMMTTELPTGPYPYAGVPWFNTPFGRDGIITALECLWLRPNLARGVLAYLASTQAERVVPEEDAEPGKILHETRTGEMAALREMPFGRYYGSVDATPLFIVLAGAYFRRTGDEAFIRSLWSNIEAALAWIDRYGDRDGDGFIEYDRLSASGLLHQGWKDSDDAIFHGDGTFAEPPIALCEVQGYAYAAKRAGARLAAAIGLHEQATHLEQQADTLRKHFEQTFWCKNLATYALALDGKKRVCRVRSSNAGQCLFSSIARPGHARRVARLLMSPDMFSGWGIRTIAASESRYNPVAYHNGSVWPHDNALIAYGFSRYGFGDYALRILKAQFEAALHFDLNRVPELFCGFSLEPDEGPIVYPVACAPQAWSAASVFLLLQSCLGLEINGIEGSVHFTRPRLPATLSELRIHNLEVGAGSVDLRVVNHKEGIGVNVLRRQGRVRIVMVK